MTQQQTQPDQAQPPLHVDSELPHDSDAPETSVYSDASVLQAVFVPPQLPVHVKVLNHPTRISITSIDIPFLDVLFLCVKVAASWVAIGILLGGVYLLLTIATCGAMFK